MQREGFLSGEKSAATLEELCRIKKKVVAAIQREFCEQWSAAIESQLCEKQQSPRRKEKEEESTPKRAVQ
jgi:phosphatidylserine/phosphatidylglycerophosphate/cardiolipin synthase-like enzyme